MKDTYVHMSKPWPAKHDCIKITLFQKNGQSHNHEAPEQPVTFKQELRGWTSLAEQEAFIKTDRGKPAAISIFQSK